MTDDGDIAVCGQVESALSPYGEGFIALLSSSGSVIGSEVYDLGSNVSSLTAISAHPSGLLSVAGSEWGTTSWTMLTEADLTTMWSVMPYSGGWSTTYGCTAGPDCVTAICGDEGYTVYSSNFFTLFDDDGNEIANEGYSTNPPFDIPSLRCLDCVESGGYCLSGHALGHCVLFRVDDSGAETWRAYYTEAGIGLDVESIQDGFLILAQSNSVSSWLIKVDENGAFDPTGMEPQEPWPGGAALDLCVHPNPSASIPSVEVSDGAGDVQMHLYEACGRLVCGFSIGEDSRGREVAIPNVEGRSGPLQPGVYILRADTPECASVERFVILPAD